MTWIRVETNVAENDKVLAFAEVLGLSAEAALGYLVRFWGRVAEHRADGDLSDMSDAALERWAGWSGMPNVFAPTLRNLFMEKDVLVGWEERQGKLAAAAKADRDRKRRARSEEGPRTRPGKSNNTSRDVEQTGDGQAVPGTSADDGIPAGFKGRTIGDVKVSRTVRAGDVADAIFDRKKEAR